MYIKDSNLIHHQSQNSHPRDICGFHFIISYQKKTAPTQLGRPTFLITRLCGQLPHPQGSPVMKKSDHPGMGEPILSCFSIERLYLPNFEGAVLLGFLLQK